MHDLPLTFRRVCLASTLAAGACAPSAPPPTSPLIVIAAPPPSASEPRIAPTPPAAEPPAPSPIPLGDGVRLLPFSPGHFAVDIRKTIHGPVAIEVTSEITHASFVLDLSPSGAAEACRGVSKHSHLDSMRAHKTFLLEEEQGYRGRWARQGAWIRVDFDLDSGVCPARRGHADLAPSPWHLRCLMVEPISRADFRTPALACQLVDSALTYDEQAPYFLPSILPDTWLFVAEGNGALAHWTEGLRDLDDPPVVDVAPSPDAVEDDTWAKP